MDVSSRALEIAERRLKLDRLPDMQRARIQLLQGSLVYRDARLAGFDAACAVEVIEHLDPSRLEAFERVRVRRRAARDGGRDDAERRVQRRSGSRCRPGSSATPTTASSGRARSSRLGERASRASTATRSPSRGIGPRTPRASARRPRWRCSRDDDLDPQALPRRPDRRLRLGQVDVRARALQAHRGALVGRLPRARVATTRTTRRRRTTPSRCCTSSPPSGWPPGG